MAAFQDQMIDPEQERKRVEEAMKADSAAMHQRMVFDKGVEGDQETNGEAGTSSGAAINSLFAPPEYNTEESYYNTIEKAKTEGKWVLVNIQQAEVFASHALNRDVWRDDTIKDIVSGSFLLWQRDDKSSEGDQ